MAFDGLLPHLLAKKRSVQVRGEGRQGRGGGVGSHDAVGRF